MVTFRPLIILSLLMGWLLFQYFVILLIIFFKNLQEEEEVLLRAKEAPCICTVNTSMGEMEL